MQPYFALSFFLSFQSLWFAIPCQGRWALFAQPPCQTRKKKSISSIFLTFLHWSWLCTKHLIGFVIQRYIPLKEREWGEKHCQQYNTNTIASKMTPSSKRRLPLKVSVWIPKDPLKEKSMASLILFLLPDWIILELKYPIMAKQPSYRICKLTHQYIPLDSMEFTPK